MAARRMTEIGDESKKRLLDAAEELFQEKGFENTTVVEIGLKAGISHGSIPWHFGNKSGILFAVVSRLFDNSGITKNLDAGQLGFNAVWKEQTYFDGSDKFPLFGAAFITEMERSESHRLEIVGRHLSSREIFIDWITRSIAVDSLHVKMPPGDIHEFWVSASRGAVVQKMLFRDDFDLSAARRGTGLALDGLLGATYFQNLDISL